MIIATEPTGKREGGWILVMDKQKGKKKKNRREGGWGRERDAKVWMDERRERPGGGE